MKKYLFSLAIIGVLTCMLLPVPGAESRVKSYSFGSTVVYKNKMVIATTNTGSLEVFTVDQDSSLKKIATFRSLDPRFGTPKDFIDVLLRVENGKLYVYATDGAALFRYDASDLNSVTQLDRKDNTTWDWFGSLTVVGGRVATVGSKGIKLWNSELQVVDSYPITQSNTWDNAYNASPATSNKYIFSITNNAISIFDRDSRAFIKEVPLNIKWENRWYRHAIYNDQATNSIYVVDDQSLRKINFNGEIEKSFRHTGSLGYDVVPSTDRKSIYFTDGIGIVKLNAASLEVEDYAYTAPLGVAGGWAMGFNVVSYEGRDRIVLFNNSGIVVLNDNLDPIRGNNTDRVVIAATTQDNSPEINEPVALGIDRNHAAANSRVLLHGQGYASNETVSIDFAGVKTEVLADYFGRFESELVVPAVKTGSGDIKVVGLSSKVSYSLGFRIE